MAVVSFVVATTAYLVAASPPGRAMAKATVTLLLALLSIGCARAMAMQQNTNRQRNSVVPLSDSESASARDVGKITFQDAISAYNLSFEDVQQGKLYSCAPPNGANIIRMATYKECTRSQGATNMTEGIAVVFKANIAPYVFNVSMYYKDITVTTTWSFFFDLPQIVNQYRTRVPIDLWEVVNKINKHGTCNSKASYKRNGQTFEAYDNDDRAQDKPLVPALIRSDIARSYHTTNITKIGRAFILGFANRATVDCVVMYTQGRSVYPYEYFGIATGDTVEMSPFWEFNSSESQSGVYNSRRVLLYDKFQERDLGTGVVQPPTSRIFLFEENYIASWEPKKKNEVTCVMAKWLEIPEAIRMSYNHSFHFAFKDITMTLVSNKTTFNISQLYLADCVPKDASKAIDAIFERKYKSTHVKSGEIEYYLANGGFLIAFQRLMSHSLADLYLEKVSTPSRRLKRSTSNGNSLLIRESNGKVRINTQSSATFASLQFAFDTIQAHVNTLANNILDAWCTLQNREAMMLNELKKINPSAVVGSLAGKPVSARMLGDVIAISKCVIVPIENVRVQDSMRIPGDNTMCYSRPVLQFDYVNFNSKVGASNASEVSNDASMSILGQLGENNELLSTRDMVEQCKAGHLRYFLLGHQYLLYENYKYVKRVNVTDIEELNPFIELDLPMLEDLDIVPVEVYTREELRDVGTLNYNDVVRFQNIYIKMFRDIDKVVKAENGLGFLKDVAKFFENTFGVVGKAIGSAVAAVAGTVVSVAKGITSFLSNPFATVGIAIAVGVCVILGLMAFRYVMTLRSDPMRTLFPIAMKSIAGKGGAAEKIGAAAGALLSSSSSSSSSSSTPGTESKHEKDTSKIPQLNGLTDVDIARLALIGLNKINTPPAPEKGASNQPRPWLGAKVMNMIRQRKNAKLSNNNVKYSRIPTNEPV